MSSPAQITLGTRGSPLAMQQTQEVRDLLIKTCPDIDVQIVEVTVTGDRIQDRALSEVGGKGLFTRELDRALLEGRCDAAVHSMKDVETWLADGIVLACILEREDVRDVFLSPIAECLEALPDGARLGTSSLRRKAQILVKRPDLDVVLFRGNVQTRLRKLSHGVADATLLAMAGLNRLGVSQCDMGGIHSSPLDVGSFLPAVAQGAVGVTIARDRKDMAALFSPLIHEESTLRVRSERSFLEILDGTCHTPIAGLMELTSSEACFRGLVAREDGSKHLTVERRGPRQAAEALARDAANELKARMGDRFFD